MMVLFKLHGFLGSNEKYDNDFERRIRRDTEGACLGIF
jgi:hypothetical protein